MKPLDPEDPMALVGVGLERGPDNEALTDMARCFVEEYARLGWSGKQILQMFRNPFYRGPHQIFRVVGDEFVRGLIETLDTGRTQARSRDGG